MIVGFVVWVPYSVTVYPLNGLALPATSGTPRPTVLLSLADLGTPMPTCQEGRPTEPPWEAGALARLELSSGTTRRGPSRGHHGASGGDGTTGGVGPGSLGGM